MKSRCKNINCKSHGGSHVLYDPRWERFTEFLADMGDRPAGKTIDRWDVFGNYCKANCRWATLEAQANNKRNTKLLYYDYENWGPGGSGAEWARYLRQKTGNRAWTVKKLHQVLQVLTLDQIIGAIHPQRPTRKELEERAYQVKNVEVNAMFDAMLGRI
jgi:FMN phosphatase YigB (HAD superfamily)